MTASESDQGSKAVDGDHRLQFRDQQLRPVFRVRPEDRHDAVAFDLIRLEPTPVAAELLLPFGDNGIEGQPGARVDGGAVKFPGGDDGELAGTLRASRLFHARRAWNSVTTDDGILGQGTHRPPFILAE